MIRKYFTPLMVATLIIALFFIVQRNYIHYNSIVSITNTRWPKVRIQIREAYNSDNPQNKVIFDQYLVKGQSRTFTVNNNNDILYRRDSNPNHPDGVHFTGWSHANCYDPSTCVINNP